jgi:signal transduction histidine kinase/CheY-like chemotaxis protein
LIEQLRARVLDLEAQNAALDDRARCAQGESAEQMRFELMVTELSAELAGAPALTIHQNLDGLLQRIVEFFGAGRAVLIQVGSDGKVDSTHAYSTGSTRPFTPNSEQQSVFAFAAERIARGEVFLFSTLGELPEEADVLRRYYECEGIKSTLVVPLVASGVVTGSFSISVFGSERPWPAPLVARFSLLGQMLANALNRARAEQDLRESEEKTRAVLAAIPDLIFYLSRDGVYLDYYAANRDDLFAQPDAFIGRNLREVLPAELAAACLTRISLALTEKRIQLFEYTLDFSPLDKRFYEARLVPASADTVLVIVRDISEHKRMEVRLRQAEKMEALGQLAGGVAHDFNNQLAVILGYAELLGTAASREEIAECCAAMTTAVQRASDLTSKLVAFSRKVESLRSPVDLHRLVMETVLVLQRTVDRRINVHHRLDAASAVVLGDASQLQNAFLNLGLNARDAMTMGGELWFRTCNVSFDEPQLFGVQSLPPGDYVSVTVEDTGEGIPPEYLPRVFEPFFTTKEEGKGTGMGLAAVHGTVASHLGAVEVRSTVGQGTSFVLYLPVSKEVASVRQRVEGETVRGQGSILVVDDDALVCRVLRNILTRLGYQATTCQDGRQAVEYLRTTPEAFDLVILDVNMPGLGGKEAFEAIRSADPEARVLIASGIQSEAQAVVDAGADGLIQKPFLMEDLARVIAKILGERPSR